MKFALNNYKFLSLCLCWNKMLVTKLIFSEQVFGRVLNHIEILAAIRLLEFVLLASFAASSPTKPVRLISARPGWSVPTLKRIPSEMALKPESENTMQNKREINALRERKKNTNVFLLPEKSKFIPVTHWIKPGNSQRNIPTSLFRGKVRTMACYDNGLKKEGTASVYKAA